MGNELDMPVEGPVLTLNPFEEAPAVPEAPAERLICRTLRLFFSMGQAHRRKWRTFPSRR